MKIITHFKDNIIPEEYSKKASEIDKILDNPIKSFPFKVKDIPTNTKFIAFTLIDYDAIEVCGFPWIHWSVANFPSSILNIPENLNFNNKINYTRGKNSFYTPFLTQDFSEITNMYVGPTPPDKDHEYTLTVYALSEYLPLKNGFFLNEFLKISKNFIIDSCSISLIGEF